MKLERLRELLDYDPRTGIFIWRVTRGPSLAGTIAGGKSKRGYREYIRIGIDTRVYLAHVLAWYWMKGELPAFELDHKDLDGTNNKWDNIRPATRSQNCANRVVFKTSRTGIKGVQFRFGLWIARISKGGERYHLGCFKTSEEARAAYMRAAQELHGDYARLA